MGLLHQIPSNDISPNHIQVMYFHFPEPLCILIPHHQSINQPTSLPFHHSYYPVPTIPFTPLPYYQPPIPPLNTHTTKQLTPIPPTHPHTTLLFHQPTPVYTVCTTTQPTPIPPATPHQPLPYHQQPHTHPTPILPTIAAFHHTTTLLLH